jgi:hypothetical protein
MRLVWNEYSKTLILISHLDEPTHIMKPGRTTTKTTTAATTTQTERKVCRTSQ